MDSLSAIGVFVQAAEARSFVAAGRFLGISASAVSKSMARLEEKLGVRLFHRSTRSIALTGEGMLYLERCKRVLGELDAANAELSQLSSMPQGRLRISLPMIGKPFLPVFTQFQRRYPDIQLDLEFTDRVVEVIEEGFDAVIRTGEPKDSGLSARPLGGFRMLVAGSPAYFSRRGVPLTPADLWAHACIHFRYPLTGKLQSWMLSGAGEDAEAGLPCSMVCNAQDGRTAFAVEGLGLIYVADFLIARELENGELITVLDSFTQETGQFNVLWPSGRHVVPKLRAFIDFLQEHLPFPKSATGA
ncbi:MULTISPECIES: LysR family transcriptional regulator [Pseudomonas]|uniref:LysR family transcriptional regulator n=1 Tax=Pseudomonas gingeri TaxID=117681 RepID=A0A7Y7WMA0_9PSED|nr:MULTISPECIES: LysR family transcriptional regulator [Pseudomonas]MBV6749113.1 LysR family transcriptional regulator [Pseudomonas chlororaphis]MPQ68258.1 LysR family transcriptional regulator [Pseudomonas sp. MWU12-2323]NWB84071.1 LysR family transcriptional regulator [Pseudomonas gingeri]RBH57376.1 LysR family transcriptional regulator [Pseudomonas sp. MWU13-2860]